MQSIPILKTRLQVILEKISKNSNKLQLKIEMSLIVINNIYFFLFETYLFTLKKIVN